MATKTGFDKYFDSRMKDPKFAAGYVREREAIDQVDALIRQLEETRTALGVSKADLARRIGKIPAVVRRLLTKKGANPTVLMAAKLAAQLGLRLGFVPAEPTPPTSEKRKHSKHRERRAG